MDLTTVNLDNLNELREKYPNKRIIFRVDSDIVAEDGYNHWYAGRCKVSLDSILDGSKEMPYDFYVDKEKWYSKDYNDDELIDSLFDSYGHHYENEIKDMYEKLPWEDVIVLHVTL